MAQRYILRLETSTGNVYGDGDVLLGNMDYFLRPEDEGKPWVKTDEYIESATPDGYEPIERSKYYGIMKCPTCGDPYTLPIKPLDFDVADALHPSANVFSRPAVPTAQIEQSFPGDVLHDVGDCMYITSAFSFSTNLVIEPDGTSGNAKRVFYGNLDISDVFSRNAYMAAIHPLAYCPFSPTLNFSGVGQALLASSGRQGIVNYSLRGAKEELIFYADTASQQAIDPINLQEETRNRVNILGQVKIEVVDRDNIGRITVKCNTSYYTSGGVLLASFDWEQNDPGLQTLHLSIKDYYGSATPENIPNIIIPGTRIHHLSVTTDPIDPESIFPKETCPSFLDGNGLAIAWDITKKWANKYKQDKLTAGDNITITDNVISATAGAPTALTRSEVTAICNNIYGANNG